MIEEIEKTVPVVSAPEFREFGKIPRLKRDCVITEKIDGTNAQIWIPEDGARVVSIGGLLPFLAGSRTRWIFPEADNAGFAAWAYQNEAELLKLGPGSHFGEWWGCGIQRNYGLKEKRFSLFNTSRWVDQSRWAAEGLREPCGEKREYAPACCGVVPVLYQGPFSTQAVENCLLDLKENGSRAVPGFMRPEGVVIYLTAARGYFKVTLEKDEEPKGKQSNKEMLQ